MRCTHHLWEDPGALRCTQELGHPDGHTYSDSHGSFVADDKEGRDSR